VNALRSIDPLAAALLVGLAAALLTVAVLGALVLARRKLRHDVREIVTALEGMRGGRPRPRPDVDPASPLGLVADATHRLGQDIAARASEAARTSLQLEALHAAAPDTAVVATDDEGTVRSFNDAAEEAFGWELHDILGQPASMLFPEDSWKDLLPKLLRRDLRTRGLRTRASLRRRDGSTFEAELFLRALRRDGSETATGFLVAVRDVEDRVRAERRLERAEARHRELVDRLGDGVLVIQDGVVVRANPAASTLLERPAEEIAGTTAHALVPTAEVLRVREWLRRIETGAGAEDDLRTWLAVPGGQVRVRLRATGCEHGGRRAVLVIVVDETVERRIEDELRRNEARLDAVLEAASDGILVLADTPGPFGPVVHVVNEAFAVLVGRSTRDLLGLAEGDLLRAMRDSGPAGRELAAAVASAGHEPVVASVTLAGEPAREIEIRCAPLRDRAGRPTGRLIACRDRTDARAPERRLAAQAEALQASLDELRGSYRQLEQRDLERSERAGSIERLNAELRRLDEMKSQLLANVSHELQTPIVAIKGYTDMIAKGRLGPVNPEQRRGLEHALRNIDRLISMIDGLLEFSRLERQVGGLDLSEFPLAALVEECRATHQPRMDERGISWHAAVDDPGLIVHGDRDKLRQVLDNLVGNAVKFNRDGGRVEVAAERKDDAFARVRVRDTGPGIPPEDLERVFDRYYRAGADDGGPKGTGLGLAIARSLLRLHGCSVRAESRPGEGATFTFTLPLAEPGAARTTAADPGEPAGERPDADDEVDRTPAADPVAEPEPGPHGPSGAGSTTRRATDDRDGARPRLRIIRR